MQSSIPLSAILVAALGMNALGAVERNEGESLPPRVELTFSTDYREAPAILDAIVQQPLVAATRITQAKLSKVYDATNPPLHHRGAVADEVAGSHAPKALVGKDGIMLWGPYAKLSAGHYLVVYRFKLIPAEPAAGTIFLDVAHNACTRSGTRLDATKLPAEKWQEIAVPVYLPEEKELEFRFWPDGNMTAIDRIYVFQVTPAAPEPPAPAELPAGERVAGRTDVLRSPHTDDRGMIDVSGLASGAMVRCPYTGKFFRVP
jgi:hypothetical protein